eukprot:SAG25_NODE_7651_length_469_cov_0.664865_1_plen_74_part_01
MVRCVRLPLCITLPSCLSALLGTRSQYVLLLLLMDERSSLLRPSATTAGCLCGWWLFGLLLLDSADALHSLPPT